MWLSHFTNEEADARQKAGLPRANLSTGPEFKPSACLFGKGQMDEGKVKKRATVTNTAKEFLLRTLVFIYFLERIITSVKTSVSLTVKWRPIKPPVSKHSGEQLTQGISPANASSR